MKEKNCKTKLIVVLGPTASGKSDLAVKLAKTCNGEIISADSRQVYKGLAIGSGKITAREMKGIPHHMIDCVSPRKKFSVAQYQKRALAIIKKIHSRKKVPILCGGTGFYIQSVVDNISIPDVPPQRKLRAQLSQKTIDELYSLLSHSDPDRAKTIDRNNPRRLIRAIEIAMVRGHVPKIEQHRERFETLQIGITTAKRELEKKIHDRLIKRIRHGMIQEVATLRKHGLSWKRLESFGLEYRFVALYLQKKMVKQEMIAGLECAIRHYAKRQMTWFKRDARIQWFPLHDEQKIMQAVQHFLSGKNRED